MIIIIITTILISDIIFINSDMMRLATDMSYYKRQYCLQKSTLQLLPSFSSGTPKDDLLQPH